MTLGLEQIPEPEFAFRGDRYLYFGGTSYLGVQYLPAFKSKLAQSILDLGAHWGASRSGNVVLNSYQQTEYELARWAGSEEALTVSSGFLAGRMLTDYFMSEGAELLFSPTCHAAILPPGQNRSSTWESLASELNSALENAETKPIILLTDTIDFQSTPVSVLDQLKKIASPKITLVADDSHGLGNLGKNGAGSYGELKKLGFKEILVCGSLGKALGVSAGVVLGSAQILHKLKDTPMFIGASPAAPANLKTLTWAIERGIYEQQLEKLRNNILYFSEQIRKIPVLDRVKNLPVWVFKNPELATYLLDHKIIITHFDYAASGESESPSRIVLTAAHSQSQIDTLSDVLLSFFKQP
jgi:7-keto-8-aminopelargonate synthetase-like enzyme